MGKLRDTASWYSGNASASHADDRQFESTPGRDSYHYLLVRYNPCDDEGVGG